MDNFDREEIKLTTQTDQYSVAPGGRIEIPLMLTNLSGTTDQVRITIEGIPLVWVSTEQPVLVLQPGEERQIILTVQPPAPPDAHAGRYNLRLSIASTLLPNRSAQTLITLTVAGYEVKGRVGVLLDGLQYSVVPGDSLAIPVVLINQGLGVDTFRLSSEDLPEGWVTTPVQDLRLEPGEVKGAFIVVQPARSPDSRAGRRPFRILVKSLQAPDQGADIDCILTVAAFIQFDSLLKPAEPDQDLLAQVVIENQSNIQVKFQASWNSPEDSLAFEPPEPQQVVISSGEKAGLEFNAKPARRVWIGNEKSYDYTVTVQASDQQSQTLKGAWVANGLLPVWAAAVGIAVLLLFCLCLILALVLPVALQGRATSTPETTATATVLIPTATQSQDDQRPLLIGRNWFLVAFNDARSRASEREAFILFNPDGTLIGFTGCKDLSGSYQTNFNQISISNINLGRGTCPDSALQQQEDALTAILRSARSYFVADTALQVAGDAGFLNFSLTPINRPEEISPPQANIQAVPQAQTEQVVVFDGSASTGQFPLVSWYWDFGDGNRASGVVVQHIYRNPGTFTVNLTVSDQRGQTASITQPIHILAAPTPTAQPIPPTATAAPPTLLPPTAPLPSPTPEPPAPTPEAPIELNPPQANISGPRSGYLGEPVEFDASSSRPGSGTIVQYSWSFGNGQDGPASPDPRVSTIYNRTGDFEVTVFVLDENGLSSNATTRISIDARLDTAAWTLSSINGQPMLPGTAITLQFLEGEMVGFAGCNAYSGRFTAVDNGDGSFGVTVDRIRGGRQSCAQDIMIQETSYLGALEKVMTASIQENMLRLTYPEGTLIFYLISPP